MKTIGLIGGMSWESTVPYYQLINRAIAAELGGLHSARILLYSVDFAEVEVLQHAGRWDEAGALLADAAARLECAGADFLLICTNTMHKVADAVQAAVGIPLLHIADPTAQAIRRAGHARAGLLGTRFTMEQDFYKQRLVRQHGLEVLVPPEADRAIVHRIIYEELCLGAIRDDSRREYQRIAQALIDAGAQCVILGCTEIGLLLKDGDIAAPLFDTTALHARAAALMAVGKAQD